MGYKETAENWKSRLKWEGEDLKLFLAFAKDASAHQIYDHRIEKYRSDLTICQKYSGFSPAEATKSLAAFKEAVIKINANRSLMWATKHDIKRTLGSLYNFRHTGDRSLKYADRQLHELVRHEKKPADRKLARPVLKLDDLRELSKFGNTLDKAIIWLLFDSGARIEEFTSLKKSDLEFIKEGVILHIRLGKTGERKIGCENSLLYLRRWLEEHPVKDADSQLWISSETKKPLTGAGIAKRIRELVGRMNDYRKKKGIPQLTVPINPHNFRHSRATYMGYQVGMTEAILNSLMGWEKGSKMGAIYLHPTAEQVIKAQMVILHRRPAEKKEIEPTEWYCSKCKRPSPLELPYCAMCGEDREGRAVSKVEILELELAELKKKNEELDRFVSKELESSMIKHMHRMMTEGGQFSMGKFRKRKKESP